MAFVGPTLNIPVGLFGMNGSENALRVPQGYLLQAKNITLSDGLPQKMKGAVKYNSSAISGTPSIIGGFDWWPTLDTQRMVVVTDAGTILKDSGSGTFATTLKSSLTVSDVNPVIVAGGAEASGNNRKLFIFTEKNPVQVLSADGATTSDLATPPTDWSSTNQPIFGLVHKNRLWGGGNASDPHRVYYSLASNHETFTGAGTGSIQVYPGEGLGIIGAVSFKKLMIVWKYPTGIYVIDTTNSDPANWDVFRMSTTIGGISPNGAVTIDDDVIFIDEAGLLYMMSDVQEFGNLGSDNITDIAEMPPFIRKTFNPSRFKFSSSVYDPRERQVLFTLSQQSSTIQDAMIVVDLNLKSQGQAVPRFHWSDRDVCQSVWMRRESTQQRIPLIGDNAGFVWKMNQDTKSKDAVAYQSIIQTPHDDFSALGAQLRTKNKIGQFIELSAEAAGRYTVQVSVLWDGEPKSSISFDLGGTGAAIGTFVIGTDAIGGKSVSTSRRRLLGSGRRLSLICENNEIAEDMSIPEFFVDFTVGDESIAKFD